MEEMRIVHLTQEQAEFLFRIGDEPLRKTLLTSFHENELIDFEQISKRVGIVQMNIPMPKELF